MVKPETNSTQSIQENSSSSFLSYFHYYVGSMYDDIHVHVAWSYISGEPHFLPRQSLLFDIITHSVQPSSLRPSYLPSPMYFHFHRPPSYIGFLSSHHMPIPLQPLSWSVFAISATFIVPLILSFIILSSFVTLHVHHSIPIFCYLQFHFLCLLQCPCLCPVH